MSRALVCAAAAAALVSGCAAMRVGNTVRTFRIAYPPPTPVPGPPLPVTVRVMPFGVAIAYQSESFVYRTGPYDIGIDPYNRWITSPAGQITDLLARDLAASHAVQVVLQSPSALPADYELGAHIETLEERDRDGGCAAHLRLRQFFVRVPRRGVREVAQQSDFSVDEPCAPGDPESYVAAMSRAVQKVSEEVRAAIVEVIRSHLAEGRPPTEP